jgi:hypothetical protein
MFAMRDSYSALPDFKFETISKKTNDDACTCNEVSHVHTTRSLKFFEHLKKQISNQHFETGGISFLALLRKLRNLQSIILEF